MGFGKVNMYWYTIQDQDAASSVTPSFGIVGSTLSTTPLFDLSCTNTTSSKNTSSSSSASASASKASGTGSSSSSGTANGLYPSGASGVSGVARPTGSGSGSNGTFTATGIKTSPAGS